MEAFKIEQFEKVVTDTLERSTLLAKNCTHKLKTGKTALVAHYTHDNIFYVCQNCQKDWSQKTGFPPTELIFDIFEIGGQILEIHEFKPYPKTHYIDCG